MKKVTHLAEGRRLVLGIETSCDETAAAVVAQTPDGRGEILSNCVRTQIEEHQAFGGVVPEIAARAHVDSLDTLVGAAMREAGVTFADLHGVAATAGPGLNSGLIVGVVTAKALAVAQQKPFLAINHLEAHALTVGLTDDLPPPYLLLLVSGGHTQLLFVRGVANYVRLGTTIDDALGEAFDKTAKLLGLGFPGGPEVSQWAEKGDASRFDFPRPMAGREEPHFSFAGLKTAVRQQALALQKLDDQTVSDICASFERAVCETVADRVTRAIERCERELWQSEPRHLVVAGGVAANQRLRGALDALCSARGYNLTIPPAALCTDNAAMVAWAGLRRLAEGLTEPLDFKARPRWPLDPDAPAAIGAGVKA